MNRRTGIAAIAALIAGTGLWILFESRFSAEITYPAENSIRGISHFFFTRARDVFERMDLAAENDRLARENARLRMNLLEATNAVRTDPGSAPFASYVEAPVLNAGGVMGSAPMIRLARGARHGIKPGAVVAAADGLVGIVATVTAHTATVRTLDDPSLRVACDLATADGPLHGILCGGGANRLSCGGGAFLYLANPLRLRHLGRIAEPPAGARIVTNGLGGVFPEGLPVARLLDQDNGDDDAVERERSAAPLVDFQALKFVYVRREN